MGNMTHYDCRVRETFIQPGEKPADKGESRRVCGNRKLPGVPTYKVKPDCRGGFVKAYYEQ